MKAEMYCAMAFSAFCMSVAIAGGLSREIPGYFGGGRSGSDWKLQTSDAFFPVRSRFLGRKTP